jgi:hypothetical protein
MTFQTGRSAIGQSRPFNATNPGVTLTAQTGGQRTFTDSRRPDLPQIEMPELLEAVDHVAVWVRAGLWRRHYVGRLGSAPPRQVIFASVAR